MPFCDTCNVIVRLITEVKRLDELRVADFERQTDALSDHIIYTKERFDSEMKRLAELRNEDVKNVSTASATATETAGVIAKQLVETDQSGRALVAATAEAAARRQEAFVSQLDVRMAEMDKKIDESVGKRDRATNQNEGRSGISVPLLMVLATLAGGLILYILQHV